MNNKNINSQNPNATNNPNEEIDVRQIITMLITIVVLLATIGVAICAFAIPDFRNSDTGGLNFVTQSLIPLWATWIGTVLAFYFGKSNFDAATKSYEKIITKMSSEEKLSNKSVDASMIPYEKIQKMDYDEAKGKSIYEIMGMSKFLPYNRYAFFDKNRVLVYMISRRNFTQYVTDLVVQGVCSPPPTEHLFEQFIKYSNDNDSKYVCEKNAFISDQVICRKQRDECCLST